MNEALQIDKIPASDISDCADSYRDVRQLLAEMCHRAPFYLSNCHTLLPSKLTFTKFT